MTLIKATQRQIVGLPNVFANRAAALAADVASIDAITIGGLSFFRDTRSAVTTGNAAFVHTDGSRWSPAGLMTFQHFGENTTPGVTDMRTAISRAIGYIKATQVQAHRPHVMVPISGLGQDLGVAGPLFTGGTKGVKVEHCRFVALASELWTFWNGTTVDFLGRPAWGNAIWNLNTDTALDPPAPAALLRHTHSFQFWNCDFNGNRIVAGFVSAFDTRNQCGVFNCTGIGQLEYTVLTQAGNNNGFIVWGCRFPGFAAGDALQLDYDNWPHRCLDLRSPDHMNMMNNCFNAKIPAAISGFGQTSDNHYWNSGGDTIANIPAGGPIAAEYNISGGVITGNYYDTGRVVFRYRPSGEPNLSQLSCSGNTHLTVSTQPLSAAITFITTTALTDFRGWSFSNNTTSGAQGAIDAEFLTEGSGSYRTPTNRRWHVSGNLRGSGGLQMVGLEDFIHVFRSWTVNAATQQVGGYERWGTSNTSATTLTAAQVGTDTAAEGVHGSLLTILVGDANTTIEHNASLHGRFITLSGSNITAVNGQSYQFRLAPTGYWHQV
jgi:hypothetical protein